MKQYLILICVIVIMIYTPSTLFSQKKPTIESIDSLRYIYSIHPEKFPRKYNTFLPPKANMKSRKNFNCKKYYNIPDSCFLDIFPFDADSILVFVPKNNSDPNSDIVNIGKMEHSTTGMFASILYNYDFKKKAELTIIHWDIYQSYPSDILIKFYHDNTENFMYLFFEEDRVRIETSFPNDLYWGEPCKERYSLLKHLFEMNYNIQVH